MSDVVLLNSNASTLPVGTPVYASSAGHVDNAKADAAATSVCIGLVAKPAGILGSGSSGKGKIRTTGMIRATTGQWDTITGGSGGLTVGARYYVSSATAGKLTTTPGTLPMQVGKAISTTEMLLNIAIPVIYQVDLQSIIGSATPGLFATTNIPYYPLVQGAGDDGIIGFIAKHKGNVELIVIYAMSASNGGDVNLTFSHAVLSTGSTPTTALTAETAFSITPGSNVTVHTLDSSVAAVLSIAVSPGDYVVMQLTRTIGGADTHTGDFRIIGMMARAV